MVQRSWTRSASIEETLALWAASLREIKKRIRPLFTQERVATNAGLFLEGLLGDEQRKTGWMRAEAAGDPGPWRQQAKLGRRDWDADALRDIVRDYIIEHLADDDAVLVIDETGFLKQGIARCGAAIHRFGRQDYELPDRRLRYLRFASWPCVHRSRVVSSERMDRGSRSSGSHICACGHSLCDQTKACDGNDRTRHSRGSAIQVGCCRYGLRRRRYRTATTPGRQRLCARSQQHSCVPILGQAAISLWHRRGHRLDATLIRLEALVGGSRNQRTAVARLVLSRIGRSRCRAVQQRKCRFVDTRSTDPSSHRR